MQTRPEKQKEELGVDTFLSLTNMRAKRIIEGALAENLFIWSRGEKKEKIVKAKDIKSKYQHLRQYLNRFMIMRHRRILRNMRKSFGEESSSEGSMKGK